MPQPLAVTAFMASPGRFELPAPRLGGVCSIQLSYGDIFDFSWSRMERSASQDFDDLIIRRRLFYPLNYENSPFIIEQTDRFRQAGIIPAYLSAHMLVTVHALHELQRILPMLRIPNRQNLLPLLYHTEFSVQKIPTCVFLSTYASTSLSVCIIPWICVRSMW